MNTNLINACIESKTVKKVVTLLSSCIYPKNCDLPLKEEMLHSGEPHNTNFGYAYAKRMLEVQARAARDKNLNIVCLIPNNLYGINDNFKLEQSHVIPGLIHRMYKAKLRGDKVFTVWGSGNALREFTNSKDIAKIIMWSLLNYNDIKPLNVGNNQEITIKDLAIKIKKYMNYSGQLLFDKTQPEGIFRKPMDTTKFKNLYNTNYDFIFLDDGLQETISWFDKNYLKIGVRK